MTHQRRSWSWLWEVSLPLLFLIAVGWFFENVPHFSRSTQEILWTLLVRLPGFAIIICFACWLAEGLYEGEEFFRFAYVALLVMVGTILPTLLVGAATRGLWGILLNIVLFGGFLSGAIAWYLASRAGRFRTKTKPRYKIGAISQGPVFDQGYRFVVIDLDGTVIGHYNTMDEARCEADSLNREDQN